MIYHPNRFGLTDLLPREPENVCILVLLMHSGSNFGTLTVSDE